MFTFFTQPLEVVMLQLLLLFIVSIFLYLNNSFYVLLYFFILTAFVGIFIGFYQLELFTGFLYVIELTVVFIMLLVLFYLNFKGSDFKINATNKIHIFVLVPTLLILPVLYSEKEWYLPNNFSTVFLWDDYYEALSNNSMNDFVGLFLSYYFFNCYELILIGILLFIGSVACVLLFNLIGTTKSINHNILKSFISFFFSTLDFYFMRKQNLNKQSNAQPGLRVIKNK